MGRRYGCSLAPPSCGWKFAEVPVPVDMQGEYVRDLDVDRWKELFNGVEANDDYMYDAGLD